MSRQRDKSLMFWLTEEEKEQVAENALAFGMTVSEFLRHAALGGTVERPTLRERNARMKEVADA